MVNRMHTTNNRLSLFLQGLFDELEHSKAEYCVLRNYANLPASTEHDVDILISKAQAQKTEQIITMLTKKFGIEIIRIDQRFSFKKYFLLTKEDNCTAHSLLELDIFTALQWRSISYIPTSTALKNRERYNEFWVESITFEASISLFKELLGIGELGTLRTAPRNKARITQSVKTHPQKLAELLKDTLSPKLGNALFKSIQEQDWDAVVSLRHKVISTLILKKVQTTPLAVISDWLSFLWGHLYDKLISPPGMMICIIGPDGSGKTTLSKGIEEALHRKWLPTLFSATRNYHGGANIFPELLSVYNHLRHLMRQPKRKRNLNITPSESLDAPPLSFFRAMLNMLYYGFEYFLAYPQIIRAKSKGQFIIFDRYFTDYYVIQSFKEIPDFVFKILFKIVPKPDLLLYLEAEPNIICTRKPELRPEQVAHQQNRCKELLSMFKRSQIYSTSVDRSQTIEKAMTDIRAFMVTRARRKM